MSSNAAADALAAVVTALAVGVVSACGGSTSGQSSDATAFRSDGPVSFPGSEVHQAAGWSGGAGMRVVYGATVVINHGDSAVTVDHIRLVGDVPSAGAEIAETRIVGLGPAPGHGDLVGAAAWPLEGSARKKWSGRSLPADGAKLEANSAAELLFVVDVHRDGDWYWPQTAMDYQVEGVRYTTTTNFGFQACSLKPKECEPVR